MSATQDYVALEWIRGELANTLQNAQVALEAVAESPDDASSMRSCLSAIHQVHGTLKMVQLEGPTQVAGEMEQVAQSLMSNSVPEVQLAQEMLMQSILQLPAYLDRLHREQEDSERNYLPMVNNLRAARGEERIAGSGGDLESVESGPDISPLTTPPSDAVSNTFFQADGEGNLPKIRAKYQQSLGAILKKNDIRGNLTTLGKLFTMLIRLCGKSPMGHLAELGLGVIEGIVGGGIKLDNTSAGLLRKIDTELKQLAAAGQSGLAKPIDEDLAKGLITLVHGAKKDTKRIAALKETYAFETKTVQEEVSIGPDDETMSAVASILIEEIRAVTDKLDLYVRAQNRDANDLVSLLPNLEQISSTMVVLGNAEQQRTVAEQIVVIKGIEESGDPDEEALLAMAQSMLHIEAGLSALVIDSEDGSTTDDFANLDEAQAAVVRETRTGLAAGKDAVIEFITADFDQSKVADLPTSLRALRGGLTIVNQTRAGDVLESAANYVAHKILIGDVTPELEQMDDLADAITSVDYYLERLLENAGDPYLQMLEVAETAVAKLGFAVGEAVPDLPSDVAVEASDLALEPEDEIAVEDLIEEDEIPEEPEAMLSASEAVAAELSETQSLDAAAEVDTFDAEPAVAEAESAGAIQAAAADTDDLIDDEILEIFVDEAEEVLETIGEFLPQWRANPADEESLIEIRRAFHTLKGSGRMVGATVVGELGWSVENLLNRVMDKTVEPTQPVLDIVSLVVDSIPEGVDAFKRGQQHEFEPQALAEFADALAEGREPPALPESLAVSSADAIAAEPAMTDIEIEGLDEADTFELDDLDTEAESEPTLDIEEAPVAKPEDGAVESEDGAAELQETTAEPQESLVELEAIPAETEETAFQIEAADPADEVTFELEETDEVETESLIEDLETVAAAITDPDEADVLTVSEDDSFEIDVVEDIEFEVPTASLDTGATEIPETSDSFELDAVDEPGGINFETVAVPQPDTEADTETLSVDAVDASTFELDELEDQVGEGEADTLTLENSEDSFDLDMVDDVDDLSLGDPMDQQTDHALELENDANFAVDDIADELADAAVTAVADSAVADMVADSSDQSVSAADELLESDDLDLDQIFTIEANEKLDTIDAFVASGDPISGDVVAAFHTLKGSAAMAEIESISTIAAPMEHLANDYLIQNKATDDHLLQNVRDASGLIRTALADLAAYRSEVPGATELIARVASGPAADVSEVSFDFQEIILLSEANIAADGWQDVEALIAEMKQADQQAQSLNQPGLSALLNAMLRVYSEAPGKPDDLTLSLMKRAHDHLVFMFDALASSQPLRPADRVIAELDAIEIETQIEAAEVVDETPATAAREPEADSTTVAAVTTLPEDDIDEDILPIFLEESEELLEEVDGSILGWSESSEPGEHLDNLLRQLHTIKGGARMAGIASLGEFAHNFETFLIGVQSRPIPFDDEFFALLNRQQDEMTRRVEIYQKLANGEATESELASLRTAEIPGAVAASAQVEAHAAEPADEAVAEPAVEPVTQAPVSAGADTVVDLPADDVDEDILPIFLEESDDLVEELESSIQSWSESPGNLDTLDLLLRNLHTLKGGARMAGLNSLGEYAHNFETFLIGIQQNPVELDDDFFALLNKRQDEVIRRVEIYKKFSFGAATPEDLESLKQALEPTLETEPVEAPEATAEKAPETEVATPAADKAASSNQEMVRVSADLLEELIGLAGESSITRGRIEQQITDFGESLQEMEETITRIRDQVRRLEIEAESRETLIRSRQSAETDSAFDELEMDRYTMLQAISRALNEGSSDMMDLKDTLANRSRDAETLLHQQARISGELQEGLTRTRMVPFARLIPRLRRIVRQISGEVGKSVRFDAYNVEGELDRNVLERIVAPLEHMLRNAVDHGIEDKDDRLAAGKNEQGRISLRLSREGGYVVLTISDDGGGINVDAVRGKATERGLITETQEVSDHEVMQFIMHAGFSTAQKLTQISGRGVGMDVVGSEIKSLGGSITIDSTLGVGTEFTIRIPFTVSINRALMVVVKEETYAVPLNTIEGIVRVSPYELEAYYQPDAPMFEYAGQPYRLAYIGKMLDKSEDPNLAGQVAPLPVILARSGDNAVALQVDKVIGSREVVVKTLGPQFGDVGGISGATVLGDGSVVIILDCMALVRSYEAAGENVDAEIPEEPAAEQPSSVRTVMIVDDSVTVRKVTTRLMERQGFEVSTAKDGVDALNQLQDMRPDVMLLDIEMPRMDGFEVLRSVRRDEAIKDLPIIMITSRTGEKHKQQAMELGVNQYLGKPFQEANLLATIEEVISGANAKPEQG